MIENEFFKKILEFLKKEYPNEYEFTFYIKKINVNYLLIAIPINCWHGLIIEYNKNNLIHDENNLLIKLRKKNYMIKSTNNSNDAIEKIDLYMKDDKHGRL